MTEYEIRKGRCAPNELWSVVRKNNRSYANFVAGGTYTYCVSLKSKLEAVDEEGRESMAAEYERMATIPHKGYVT